MAPAFLRSKKPRPESGHRTPSVRPSLSLPDLTTPLIDPSNWEEVPPFSFSPQKRAAVSEATSAQGAKGRGQVKPVANNTFPTRIKHAVHVQQGRLLFQNLPESRRPSGAQPYSGSPAASSEGGYPGRISEAEVARQARNSILSSIRRNNKDKRRGAASTLNVVVAGGKDTGKTSFVRLLLASSMGDGQLDHVGQFSPAPTLHPQAHTFISDIGDRLQVHIIDTPGLDLTPMDPVRQVERERGVLGLNQLVEGRYDELWREERKVRRKVGVEDGLVHLVLYTLDARNVLRPDLPVSDELVDWSCAGLFEPGECSQGASDPVATSQAYASPESGLSEIDLDIIRRLSRRSNVLPMLTHADGLTSSELALVKSVVRRDLSRKGADLSGGGFGIFGLDEDDLDDSSTFDEDSNELGGDKGADVDNDHEEEHGRGSRTGSTHSHSVTPPDHLPFAVFASDLSPRSYPWGDADVHNPAHSDLQALRDAIFDDRATQLRESTREVLYERYRTERLLSRQSTA
ncbi:hypothetical protein IAU60_002451 [Kwoniella sp. DSM 27419]